MTVQPPEESKPPKTLTPTSPQSDPKASPIPAPVLEARITGIAERRVRDNRIVEMVFVHKMTYAAVAKAFGVSKSVVAGVIYRYTHKL
jgi:hypothetical protein